ncbi:MAG: hypothetical protein SGI88_14720 [Candidatus Hydrogenedentes bacterium]|nr:hypothetical protein [Candidatus Hydrogenedentota bacterium]
MSGLIRIKAARRSFIIVLAVAALIVAGSLVHAAEKPSGNRGVIMRKQPAEKPEAVEPLPQSAPREPAEPAPNRQAPPREPVIVPPKQKPLPVGPVTTVWPAAFHDYFLISPESPTVDDVLGTLVTYLNRQTLAGRHPDAELTRFEEWMQQHGNALPRKSPGVALVEGFYCNLAHWTSLEAQYTSEYDRGILGQLVRVVESQSQLDPGFDEARRQKIVSTVTAQGLFVPAGILFGYSVLPYRAVNIPAGYAPFESPTKPQFADTPNRAEALYDFIEAPGPIFRVDFDTIEATSVRIEQSADGKQFQRVQEWLPRDASGVRPPAILTKPFRSRFVKLVVESREETAVLRNPRVFALKEPAAAISAAVESAPELDGSFKEPVWPQKAQIDGFIDISTLTFAEAQTTVRACHTNDTLFIAVYAREPRMNTMSAAHTARDASLTEEESVTIMLRPTGHPECRFTINPLGTQFDSRDGDASWNAEWRAVTQAWPVGWSAEIAIPFAALGASPGTSDWNVDFARTRKNVTNELSVWSHTDTKGLLIF